MRRLSALQGMTLIEIIIALALLGIVVMALLNMFSFSYTTIFSAGFRSERVLEVQTIVDDLLVQNDTQRFATDVQIKTYLAGQGYNGVSTPSLLDAWSGTNDINYYVNDTLQTKAFTEGYEVTILKFFDEGKQSVRITVFVIKGGA